METLARYVELFVPMLWLGMVLAISFLEAPLKFRAPGITIPLGLGIGRLVFRALNTVEGVLALVLITACLVSSPGTTGWILLLVTVAVLAVQVAVIRPPLTRRSNRILAGEDAPRSKVHYAYVALEIVKVALLIALAIVLARTFV
ncbi:probable conserved transmembrane protein [Rhodococcus aetherivorans]|uniref:Probable conserved transmembrane protein n=1 Tax=Rhodococcus aetherivorans TaxID=191292 RepID=A0A059MGM1_9NOCA|nr:MULTISPECIES: hypothetical protein [Rhodococcus]ETT25017.1 hypothetical protein RR21198_4173 [Rhodococcus rhodochrous ATCC 21198]KDE10300.1 membrane protein [Rhodococcus aetherivorans]NGP26299.1 hypothetical protein [Rhodococcus aetherivorans]QIX48640.1 hypothetical protein HFP48_03115 [Rhodococcus sp. DMU1]UYF93882.1 hypothetical protein OCS65_26235 [Rhodococcus aetherivorans]